MKCTLLDMIHVLVLFYLCYFQWTVVGMTQASRACAHPNPSEHATYDLTGDAPFAEGTVATFHCKIGFKGHGRNTYTCSSGDWINGNLECIQIKCNTLNPPENGYISDITANVPGGHALVSCNQGYDLKGNASFSCNASGHWISENSPTCEVRLCNFNTIITNGKAFPVTPQLGDNAIGSIVAVACNDGFVISGLTKVKCQEDGTWEKVPSCKKSDCGSHPGITQESYKCIKETYFGQTKLFIDCEDNASITGNNDGADTCFPEEQLWNSPEMTCRCGCRVEPEENVILINVDKMNYISHNRELEWYCSSGRRANTAPLKCLDGTITQPKCSGTPLETQCESFDVSKTVVVRRKDMKIHCMMETEFITVDRFAVEWIRADKIIAKLKGKLLPSEIKSGYGASTLQLDNMTQFSIQLPSEEFGTFTCVLKDNDDNKWCNKSVGVTLSDFQTDSTGAFVVVILFLVIVVVLLLIYINKPVISKMLDTNPQLTEVDAEHEGMLKSGTGTETYGNKRSRRWKKRKARVHRRPVSPTQARK